MRPKASRERQAEHAAVDIDPAQRTSVPLSEDALQISLSFSPGISRRGVPARRSFARWISAALQACGHSAGNVELRVVDAEEGRELNSQWRGKNYPTNVLSFPSEDALPLPGMPVYLGDIAFCAPVVLDEARSQGKRSSEHWAHLSVHGTLHLLGHDHIDDAQAAAMEALETRILSQLGVADPYKDHD